MTTSSIVTLATVYPPKLRPGDKIAIVAPSSNIKEEPVEGATEVIRGMGFEPVVFPSASAGNRHYSSPREQRLKDMTEALTDPEIRAVLCARGGYGMVHILDSIAELPIENDPKWIIGFSDISALHALMAQKGIASIHASMAIEVARGMEEEENKLLFDIMQMKFPQYEFNAHPLNHIGEAEGKIVGGNLSVLQNLIDTPYDIFQAGDILFIEDLSEPIYKIERMLYQLKFSGVLDNIKAIIVGQFTDCRAGEGFTDVEKMITNFMASYPDLPVAFNIPIGHIRHNMPIVESSSAKLTVTPDGVSLHLSPE